MNCIEFEQDTIGAICGLLHRCLRHRRSPATALSHGPGSARRRQLDVPSHQRSTPRRRAFSVAGPIVWNSLRDELRDDTEDSCLGSH